MWNKKKQLISSSRIPEELQYEILLRLPVKSILICKSVCKSWLSIISNPSFAKFHLQQNIENPSSSRLLVGFTDDIYSLCYDLINTSLSTKDIEYSAVKLRCQFKLDARNITLLGSCNGLVFLWHTDYSEDSDNDAYNDYGFGGDDFFCVWNPATGKFRKIQSPLGYFENLFCIYGPYGLGYDSTKKDYKCVVGTCSDESKLNTEVEVFSLRSNSWETIEIPYSFSYDMPKAGVLVDGDLHWLAKGESGACIVYLDSSSDMPLFKEVQSPSLPNLEFVSLGVLEEGRLCVVAHNGYPASTLRHVEVWELQMYGVRESWTQRYVISDKTITREVMVKPSGLKIMWSFKNGNIVFVNSEYLVLYNPKNECATKRKLFELRNFSSEVNYVESLVSPNSGTRGHRTIREINGRRSIRKETEKEEKQHHNGFISQVFATLKKILGHASSWTQFSSPSS